jgi:hypothetical protein
MNTQKKTNDVIQQRYENMIAVVELDNVVNLLKTGLGEIQKITANNDFYEPIFMFLSQGLERLFKIILCLSFKEKNNRFPYFNEIWRNKNGHDLCNLKKEIEKICIPVEIPFAAMDYDIITKDKFINDVCSILSEYGQKGRYFNLDILKRIL